jgi:hypothetical protein
MESHVCELTSGMLSGLIGGDVGMAEKGFLSTKISYPNKDPSRLEKAFALFIVYI